VQFLHDLRSGDVTGSHAELRPLILGVRLPPGVQCRSLDWDSVKGDFITAVKQEDWQRGLLYNFAKVGTERFTGSNPVSSAR
jgi:hypothetical protein